MNKFKNQNFIGYAKQSIGADDIKSVTAALQNEYLTQGQLVQSFEDKLKKYFMSKYCTVVSSGTAALHLAGKVLEWSSNDIIVTTPITFVATANSILYAGSKPVFIDIDKETYNIDLDKLETYIKKLKKINKKIKTVIAVDYSGMPCDWKSLRYLANRYKFTLLNDNCHAMGSKYFGSKGYAVKFADIVTHSYHAVKNITTGEGGAILSNNKKFDKLSKILRTHGIEKSTNEHWKYKMQYIGFNYRLTDFQCALGISQLSKLDSFTIKRRYNAKFYENLFKNNNDVELPKHDKNFYSSFHFFPIRIKSLKTKNNKDKFLSFLKKRNIFLQVHYTPIFLYEFYKKNFKINYLQFKEALEFFKEEVSLPTYPDITISEMEIIVKNIKLAIKSLE